MRRLGGGEQRGVAAGVRHRAPLLHSAPVRVWIDITNSPHVVIFRPIIARLRARGHEVTVTAREFAQMIGLLERFGIEYLSVGAHGGESRAGKARAMARRSAALVRFAGGALRPRGGPRKHRPAARRAGGGTSR